MGEWDWKLLVALHRAPPLLAVIAPLRPPRKCATLAQSRSLGYANAGSSIESPAVATKFTLLETPRLILRPITPTDWAAIHRYMSDPAVTRWLPEGVLGEPAARAFAVKNAGEAATAIAVIERETDEFVGHMVFHPWFVHATHEIGWVISAAHQGRGFATEAARALLSHAFGALQCHRVIATCQPENPASWRVMEKLGMRREAHFRSALHQPSGEWWDEYFYALLAEEYAS
jgi:RimJ/RimL family protein N-acetyltransferase